MNYYTEALIMDALKGTITRRMDSVLNGLQSEFKIKDIKNLRSIARA